MGLLSRERMKKVLINRECDNCNEPSKFVCGFWDGAGGAGGHMFDCKNMECPVKIMLDASQKMNEEAKNEVARENLKNKIIAKNLTVARQAKKLVMYDVAKGVGISSAELSSYEYERRAIPKELYIKIMHFIGSVGK